MLALLAVLASVLTLGGVAPLALAANPPVQGTNPGIEGEKRYGATVSAVPGDWQPAPVELSYQWYDNDQRIEGATGKEFTIPLEMLGHRLSVAVTGTKEGFTDTVLGSSSYMIHPRLFDKDGTLTVTGGTQIGDLLTVSTSGWEPQPTGYAFEWFRFTGGTGVHIGTETSYRLTEADAGRRIYVEVRPVLAGYSSRVGESVEIPAQFDAAPEPSVTVTGGGMPRVGTELAGDAGVWEPTPAGLAYQWLRNGQHVDGATSPDYTPVAADSCWELSLRVTGTRAGRQVTVRTSAPQQIRPVDGAACAQPMVPGTPTITGTAQVGKTLTAVPGSWTPVSASFTYQWNRNGAVIPGATSAEYAATPDDLLQRLSVTVTGTRDGWVSTSASSAAVDIWAGQLVAPAYEIVGKAEVGSELTAYTDQRWEPEPVNRNYRWFYDGKPVPGTDSQTHVVRSEGLGKTVSVEIIGSKIGYDWKTLTLDGGVVQPSSVALKAFTTAPVPKIVGTPKVGAKLEVIPTGWAPSPGEFAYQWLRGGRPIPGAHTAEHTVSTADAGARLSVRVTAYRHEHQETARTSAGSLVAPLRLNAAPKPRVVVVGGGTAKVGKRLTVRPGAWKPAKVTLTYRWLRNGTAITGATKSKYKLTRKDRGKRISVRVTGKKSGYVTVSKTSSAKRVSRAVR